MDFSAPLAPIVLFCYNRPAHLQQTLQALQANTLAGESELHIFSDGPKSAADRPKVEAVRQQIAALAGFRKIHLHLAENNRGLANSVIAGVTRVIRESGKVIVLEDDMLTTPDFLEYMNAALHSYHSRADIFSVTAYNPPINIPENYTKDLYLAPRASSWGWGTWAEKWQLADWNMDFLKQKKSLAPRLNQGGNDLWPMLEKQQRGIIDSWAVRWTATQTLHGAYGVYPVHSKIKNIGTDGSGTNFTFASAEYGQELSETKVAMEANLQPDSQLLSQFRAYYNLPFLLKIKNRIKYGI